MNGSQYDITPVLVIDALTNKTVGFYHVVQKESPLSNFRDDLNTIVSKSNKCKAQQVERKKRSVNGQPVNLYVDYLLVLDYSVYNKYQKIFNTYSSNIVMQFLRIQYSHIMNAVNINFVRISGH